MNARMTLELSRLASLEACEVNDADKAHADYLDAASDRLRDDVDAHAAARLTAHLRAGGMVRISLAHYSDTVGRHADATSPVQRFSTVAYSPGEPAGETRVHETAEAAALAFVRCVGPLAVLDELEPADECDEDHAGEARAERENDRAERGG